MTPGAATALLPPILVTATCASLYSTSTNLLRGLNVQASDPNAFASTLQNFGNNMGQRVMYSPSVFNYFSPDYVIPGTTTFGPEFQLLTTATTVVRQNFVDTVVKNQLGGGTTIDLTSFANMASNP